MACTIPVDLSTVDDIEAVRRSLLRSMGKAGRAPGVKGGGNSRKRTRLVIALDDSWTAAGLADAIASGNLPTRRPSGSDGMKWAEGLLSR